ncbi:MAG: recombination regulator RecX [Veillonellaceae bacterium]|nr:recombination regulator RecX [Veillonellaceae bacterium]
MKTEEAFEQAVRYLGNRSYSELELRRKLQAKHYTADETDAALMRLRERGYVDDAALAERVYAAYVADGVYGNAYIAYRLHERGLEMPARLSAAEEIERAQRLVERKLLGSGAVSERKLASFLANRGYGAETACAVRETIAAAGLLDRKYKKNYNK